MNQPECSYIVKSRAAFLNNETGEVEFLASEKKFTNKSPILAREEAFRYRNLIIAGMIDTGTDYNLYDLGWDEFTCAFTKATDRELRKILNQFFPPDENEDISETLMINSEDTKEEIVWVPPDDTLTWYPSFNSGIWILVEQNDSELIEECEPDDDIVIDKITRYEEPLPTPPNYFNLEFEYKFYIKHGYETKDYEIQIDFLDDESYLNGDEDYYTKGTILKTEFDWTGYDKMGWWEKNSDKSFQDIKVKVESNLPYSIGEAFALGENHFAEYKPGLINRPNSDRDIEFEIVSAICAFLNKEGGYLFIGVADKKKRIIGLKFPENSQDKFLREFTRIKLRHIPPHIAHTINGEFYDADDKMIFGITIPPSNAPVFVKIRDENNKVTGKNFYVRSDASSRHLYDIEEVVKYCTNHWTRI